MHTAQKQNSSCISILLYLQWKWLVLKLGRCWLHLKFVKKMQFELALHLMQRLHANVDHFGHCNTTYRWWSILQNFNAITITLQNTSSKLSPTIIHSNSNYMQLQVQSVLALTQAYTHRSPACVYRSDSRVPYTEATLKNTSD